MRLFGIAALALILVGVLIFLGQSGAFDGAWQRSESSQTERFEDRDQTVLANFDTDGTSVFGAPVVQESPLILSGMPSYAGLEFRLPVDARPTSGDLALSFSSLVADDVEGVLRVSINGVKRADHLLSQGEKVDSLQVQLTQAELTSGVLAVGLSLQGRGPIAECTSEDAIAAVVSIHGSSGLQLNLASAPETTRDQLALWGDRVPVSWSSTISDEDAASTIHQSASLFAKGYAPILTDDGVASDALLSLAGEAAPRKDFTIPASYPISLASDSTNEGLRRFTRRVNWRYAYRASEMPGGRLPSALDLRMQVGPATTRLERDVSVTINNRLLYSRRIASDVERLNQSIAIPASAQGRSNAIDITISAYDSDDLRCGDIAQSVAELLPETVLRDGPAAIPGELETLAAALQSAGSVAILAEGVSAADATIASYLVSGLAPQRWEPSLDASLASVQVLADSASAARMELDQGSTHWVVYADGPSEKSFSALRLPNPSVADLSGIALLVSVAGRAVPQEANDATE